MALAFDKSLGTLTSPGSFTTSATAVANSRIILFLWWYGNAQTLSSASGGSLSWVVDKQFEASADDQHVAIVSADAPGGLASGTGISFTFSAGPDFGPAVAAASFTGVATGASGYLDTTSTGKDDFEETWTTNNLVTTNADDLLVAISMAVDGTSNTATAPAAEIHDWTAEGSQRAATVYRIVSSTGTYNIGGVWSTAVGEQVNIGAAYKAAPTGDRTQVLRWQYTDTMTSYPAAA